MIKVFNTKKDFDHYRLSIENKTIGLIPTMGNLHKGHLSLIEESAKHNDISIVTIFVNPKQFGPAEDFDKYPRTLDEDLGKISALALLIDAKKEIVVFAPASNEEIYPKGFSTQISVGEITKILEGNIRPTHFDGVCTVVYRLFTITKAQKAYFGQKDFQQCLVIKKMVLDLAIPIEIIIMPIIRNAEGLALSSRNQYLSESEKKAALHLPETLQKIEKLILTKQAYSDFIASTLSDPKWDYLEVRDADTLNPIGTESKKVVILGVFRLGSTRLLDNIVVEIGGPKS